MDLLDPLAGGEAGPGSSSGSRRHTLSKRMDLIDHLEALSGEWTYLTLLPATRLASGQLSGLDDLLSRKGWTPSSSGGAGEALSGEWTRRWTVMTRVFCGSLPALSREVESVAGGAAGLASQLSFSRLSRPRRPGCPSGRWAPSTLSREVDSVAGGAAGLAGSSGALRALRARL